MDKREHIYSAISRSVNRSICRKVPPFWIRIKNPGEIIGRTVNLGAASNVDRAINNISTE